MIRDDPCEFQQYFTEFFIGLTVALHVGGIAELSRGEAIKKELAKNVGDPSIPATFRLYTDDSSPPKSNDRSLHSQLDSPSITAMAFRRLGLPLAQGAPAKEPSTPKAKVSAALQPAGAQW